MKKILHLILTLLSLHSHGTLSCGIIFDGQGQLIDFFLSSSLTIDSNQSLTIKNALIGGMKTDWLNLPSSSVLILDNVISVSTFDISGPDVLGKIIMSNNPQFFNGIRMRASSTLEYNSNKKFEGAILFNNGTISLQSNLDFGTTGSFSTDTSGTITGNGYQVFLNKAHVHNGSLTITNSLTLDGRGNLFNLNNSGSITVDSFITFTLKDLTLKNLKTDWISAGNSSTSIVFDNVKVQGTKTLNIASPITLGTISGSVEFID